MRTRVQAKKLLFHSEHVRQLSSYIFVNITLTKRNILGIYLGGQE
jgi:hypothetical protein